MCKKKICKYRVFVFPFILANPNNDTSLCCSWNLRVLSKHSWLLHYTVSISQCKLPFHNRKALIIDSQDVCGFADSSQSSLPAWFTNCVITFWYKSSCTCTKISVGAMYAVGTQALDISQWGARLLQLGDFEAFPFCFFVMILVQDCYVSYRMLFAILGLSRSTFQC